MPSLELLPPRQDIHLTNIQITMKEFQQRFPNLEEESQLPRNELANFSFFFFFIKFLLFIYFFM